jgi:hypothetical protein
MRAAEAVERLGQQADRMEVFGARPLEPSEACIRDIDESDFFVGVYAYRYGFIPEGSDVSITEMEFQHAVTAKKPVFCFMVDESYQWPPEMIEAEPGYSKLTAFKDKLKKQLVRDTFTTPDNLGFKLAASLGRYLTERSSPLYGQLEQMVESMAGKKDEERRKVVDALDAAMQIVNRTVRYFADQRQTGERNLVEERALSDGWQHVGTQLAQLQNPPQELIERLFYKSQYWSDPDMWTTEWVAASRIGLEEIANESRTILLARVAPQP